MEVRGAFAKRKSFTKIQPEMPRRKISSKSREESKRNHRTEHKLINSPEIELTTYKRKNFVILNQLQVNNESQGQSKKSKKLEQLKTNRTKESTHLTEQTGDISQNKTTHQPNRHFSYSQVPLSSQTNNKELNLIKREQLTSRFTININEGQDDSLTHLLHQTKSKNSNPLINTARLTEHQNKNMFETIEVKNRDKTYEDAKENLNYLDFQSKTTNKNVQYLMQQAVQQDLSKHSQNADNQIDPKESNDFDQKQSQQEAENFDDYQFGGGQSSNELKQSQLQSYPFKNPKTKHMIQPPKIKAYGQNEVISQKPQNWRDLNRYILKSKSEHRMDLEVIKNQKAALQGKRERKQINDLLQEYQKNKNSIHLQSQRKIESNRIIQNFYRERRINSQKKNSSSLPHLKVHSQPKHIILVPPAGNTNVEIKNYKIEPSESTETILKKLEQKSKVRSSLSFAKLGFGSSNPRPYNHEDVDENQLQNVINIQKKLRQKGIQFHSDTLRKALLNFRDGPISKLSKTDILSSSNLSSNNLNKFEVPEKQLPSNAFYKIFPL